MVSYNELRQTFGALEARSELERWLVWGGYPAITVTPDLTLRQRLLNELVGSYLYRDILEMEGIKRSAKADGCLV